ncbi:MAG: S8 family serine peptidase [Sedimentisphaerales bacterium]|nr:S8 family serine peptidase [Sedimentisphaerales bacterium]
MKNKVFLFFAIILFILLYRPAVASENSRSFAPNEIIVKFRENTAKTIEKQLDNPSGIINLPSQLTLMDTKHRARQIRPLVKNFRARHQRMQSIQQKNYSILTAREKHILRRLQRAPAQTNIPNIDRIYKITLDCPTEQALQEALEAYRNNPEVEYAELNYSAHIESAPDDPLYDNQWALEKINTAGAWNIYTGNNKIVVAVLDTGIDYYHRDIVNNMWINNEEYDGIEGIDDDNNGYIDDIHGYNFIYNNGNPLDDHGHGTHCAGIIGAEGNNGFDISGVCWDTSLMSLKAFNYDAGGYTYDLVEAIIYAVTNGADIISNSWTIDEMSDGLQSIKEAFDYAYSQGVISIAAAGNQNINEARYPAGFQNVISVAAIDADDNRWFDLNSGQGSNYGEWIDLAAPGVGILSLRAENTGEGIIFNQYTTKLTGTSMACPHVTGACALLLSANPTMTYRDVYNKLTETTDPIASGICRSNGRLNVSRAMQAVVPSKGYVNFDQDYYTYTSKVGILLADRDLKGKGSQEVTVATKGGDSEEVVLTETSAAFGVFTGNISINSEQLTINDGILQASSGDVVTVTYVDPYSGPNYSTSTDIAFIDYEAPILTDIQIEIEARHAIIDLTTNEQTKATIHYGRMLDEILNLSQEDTATSTAHTFYIESLTPETDYYFIIDLADLAGNKTTVVKNDMDEDFSFMTSSDTIGLRVPDGYGTIQAAINAASDGDTIWVADGLYTGTENRNIDFKGKAITLKSENGPESCIIDCFLKDQEGFAVYFHSGEGPDSVINGFTLMNGYVGGRGGAISCDQSSPTITNCIFQANKAGKYGGAIYNFNNSSPTITYCTFYQNSAGINQSESGNGGGICNLINSNPNIIDCLFFRNSATYQGGGIYNDDYSEPVIIRCTFKENSAKYGGGIYNYFNSNPTLSNCLFTANSADYGGAIQNAEATVTLKNCVLTTNSANRGGGIWNSLGGISILNNCIIWNNSDINGTSEAAQIYGINNNQNSIANYCCIQNFAGGIKGIGNINNDPLFFDPDNDDFHLKSTGWRWDKQRQRWHYDNVTSPCIDAGNPGSPLNDELLTTPDDPTNKWGINIRINMGIYGGTNEASLAPYGWNLPGDLTNDGNVNMKDFAAQIKSWPGTENELPGDLNKNGTVDAADLTILAKDWLVYIKPPSVSIISPTQGSVFDGPSSDIDVQAEAWDENGSVVKVEFYADGVKIGEDSDASDGWKINWTEHALGEYFLTAKATDNGGITSTSDEVTVWIVPLH